VGGKKTRLYVALKTITSLWLRKKEREPAGNGKDTGKDVREGLTQGLHNRDGTGKLEKSWISRNPKKEKSGETQFGGRSGQGVFCYTGATALVREKKGKGWVRLVWKRSR